MHNLTNAYFIFVWRAFDFILFDGGSHSHLLNETIVANVVANWEEKRREENISFSLFTAYSMSPYQLYSTIALHLAGLLRARSRVMLPKHVWKYLNIYSKET